MLAVVLLLAALAVSSQAEEAVYKKPEIYSLHIYSDIKYRFATTKITSRVKNPDTRSREAIFDVTLPNEAFITNLTLEIDDKIVLGEIKEKEAAKKQYQEAQQRGESAGYIGTQHRETNRFNLAITVSPQSKVSFNLTYQELLKRKHAHYEQVIYIDPGQPVPDMDVTVTILESRNITFLKVPPLRNDVETDFRGALATVISRPTPKSAKIKFVPSIEHQTAQSSNGIAGQFVVQYDVERDMDAGDVLVVNGYFVHFFAPTGFQPIPNDILFVLDKSGSMTGVKMQQLKDAMISILDQLYEGDRINIMTFSGSTSYWKTEMVDITDEDTKEEAKTHIKSISAGGWTNINEALTSGLDFLTVKSLIESKLRSPVLVFLTDGEATQGIKNTDEILKNVKSTNEGEIPIFTLAFGKGADYDIVKKIAIQNNGFGRKIYEASDASMQIAGFYSEIAVTLLSNITFQYLDAPVSNITKHEFTNYFNGSECVVTGRINETALYTDDGPQAKSIGLKVLSNSIDGPQVLVLANDINDGAFGFMENLTNVGDYEMITEKIWAYLTIKELLDKKLVSSNDEEILAFNRQVLELSLKYGFVTPLTSMVVTKLDKPDEGESRVADEEEYDMHDTDLMARSQISIKANSKSASDANLGSRRIGKHNKMSHYYPNVLNNRKYLLPTRIDPVGHSAQYHSRQLPVVVQKIASRNPVAYMPRQKTMPRRRPVQVQSGKKRITQHKRMKPKRQKNRKQRGKKSKDYTFPLRVKFRDVASPLCFNLYDDGLETTSPATYLLYANSTRGLEIKVQLEKTLHGKWTKQGLITAVTVSENNRTDTIKPTGSGNDTLFGFDEFEMLVIKADANLAIYVVKRTTGLENEGILGDILSKEVELDMKKNKKGKKAQKKKTIGLLRINTHRRFAVKERILSSTIGGMSRGGNKCWALRKREALFYNMEEHKTVA